MKKIVLLLLAVQMGWAQQPKRKLVWEENFNGTALDEKSWNFETGDGCPNNCGFGNRERQVYTKENHKVADGFLTITAKKDGNKYTSTRITTKGKREYTYGRIEARLQLPKGGGIWPAFWMLGANISEVGWPKSGEIDIMEYVGREPEMIYGTLHYPERHGANADGQKKRFPKIEEGFHVYATEWEKDKISFFVDGTLVHSVTREVKTPENWPFDKPFFLLLNMAVGGDFGGPAVDDSIFPQQYVIDYIRVYQ